MPEISVIMGIYNTHNETMVKLAINSILNQTYNNFELIICDDGSTDGTYDLVKKLTEHDGRVILIKNKVNQGLAKTLNNCLEIAKGKYIARMDADDISVLNRFEKQIEFLNKYFEYDLVGSNIVLFDQNGDWGFRSTSEFPGKRDFLFGSPFVHPSILIRKEVMDALGGYRIDKETLRCEDYDLFMRFYAQGKKGYNIQEPLLKFREDKGAYKRRRYKFRYDEAKVRYKGFKMLELMPIGYLYTIKPLIVGIIPQEILALLRREG
jgi:glycosyltransferase EpsE